MRYTPAINPVVVQPASRRVQGLVATPAIKPISPHEGESPARASLPVSEQGGRTPETPPTRVERRVAQRRILHRPVLVELRSGVERRKRNLLDGGVIEHIDIKV